MRNRLRKPIAMAIPAVAALVAVLFVASVLYADNNGVIGGDIDLTPQTDTNPVGTFHTLTATIVDSFGVPFVGDLVTFAVISGHNAGVSGTCSVNADCTSDANGQVSFTYTSNGTPSPPDDVIQASFTDPTGVLRSTTATKTWVLPPAVVIDACLTSTLISQVYDGSNLSAPLGVFTFTVEFENTGCGPITEIEALVTDLTGGATGLVDYGGVGDSAPVPIPATSDYSDAVLGADETVTVDFGVLIGSPGGFSFTVSGLGVINFLIN